MEYGETISRTGSMIVRSDAPVSVSQNGVDWVPIGLVDGAPQFILGSAGRMSISVNGREIFFFTVEINYSFTFSANNLRQYNGASEIAPVAVGGSKYWQTKLSADANRCVITIRPTSITPAELVAKTVTSNQEVNVSTRINNDLANFDITNFDASVFLQISIDGVFIGFASAADS